MERLTIVLLLSCICYTTNGMEMRETVERMVMVRRTGSDLQPAATGFIYRSDNNGPASVIKLGETDINKHLDNLPAAHYEEPKEFVAPIPVAAGPFYNKEEDEGKAESKATEHIIPVVELKEEDDVAGNAGKVEEYAADFGDYKNDFDNYLSKYFGHLVDDHHHHHHHEDGNNYEANEHSENADKGKDGHASSRHYGKGGAGDYHSEKEHSYAFSTEGDHDKHHEESDAHGSDFDHGHFHNGGDHGHKTGHSKGENTDGFHKHFDKEEFKKDHDFYDEEGLKGGFHKFADGHGYHGHDVGGFEKGNSHQAGHEEDNFGKFGFHEKGSEDDHGSAHFSKDRGDRSYHHGSSFGAQNDNGAIKGYGYEIKH